MTALVAAGSAPLGGHLWHVVGGLALAAVSAGSLVWDRVAGDDDRGPATSDRARARPTGRPLSRLALLVMAAAGFSAAVVHFRVMPEHFAESVLYGAFFACLALAQVAYAVLVLARPRRSIVAAGAVANAAVVALWLVTRLAGIPLGPAAGDVEEFGVLDVLASSLEVVVVLAACCALWAGPPRARVALRAYPRPAKAGALAVIVATAVVCGLAPVT